MQEQPPPVRVERVRGSNHRVTVAATSVIFLMLLVVAIPWGGPARRPSSPLAAQSFVTTEPPPSFASVGAVPTPDADLASALARRQCQNPAVWRVVTHE